MAHHIQPTFMASEAGNVPRQGHLPAIVHVTPDDFLPSLTRGELDCIDRTFKNPRGRAARAAVMARSAGARPMGGRSVEVLVNSTDMCANCGKANDGAMRHCDSYVTLLVTAAKYH